MSDAIPTPPRMPRRGFLFRNRFVVYAILILVFGAWRVYRYRSWEKKHPDVFEQYQEYLQNNSAPVAEVRPKSEAELLQAAARQLRGLSDDEEKRARIDELLAPYFQSEDPAISAAASGLVRMKAELTGDRDEKRRLYEWILARRDEWRDAPEFVQVNVITAAAESLPFLPGKKEKLELLDDILVRYAGDKGPWIQTHLTQLKIAKAELLDNKADKIRLYDEVIAVLENEPRRSRGQSRLAHAILLKANNTDNKGERRALLERVITTFGQNPDRHTQYQVLWALEQKARMLDEPSRLEVYDLIIEKYGSIDDENIRAAVLKAEENKERPGYLLY